MALSVILSGSPLGAETVIWQQGGGNAWVLNYGGAQDAFLVRTEEQADYNFGGKPYGEVSEVENRALLRFDLSSFAGRYAQIQSIRLTLYRIAGSNNTYGTLRASAILAGNQGWTPGVGNGTALEPGAATWNHANAPAVPWAGEEGLGTPSVDYSPTLGGQVNWTSAVISAGYTIEFSGSPIQLKALVDQWTNASKNAGILVVNEVVRTGPVSSNNIFAVAASEYADPSVRPKLEIIYSTEPAGSPFEEWLTSHFSPDQLGDTSISGPNASPAGDGVANLMKYALGIEPFDFANASRLPQVGQDSGFLTLSFIRMADATDITYNVIGGDRPDAEGAIWSSTGVPYGGGVDPFEEVTVSDGVPMSEADARFLRLRVSLTHP